MFGKAFSAEVSVLLADLHQEVRECNAKLAELEAKMVVAEANSAAPEPPQTHADQPHMSNGTCEGPL
jgi:hypothetical protein